MHGFPLMVNLLINLKLPQCNNYTVIFSDHWHYKFQKFSSSLFSEVDNPMKMDEIIESPSQPY